MTGYRLHGRDRLQDVEASTAAPVANLTLRLLSPTPANSAGRRADSSGRLLYIPSAILALPERSVMNVYSGVPCSSSTSISLSVFTGDSACAAMGGSSACDCSRWPAPLTAPRHSLGSRTCTSRLARIRDVRDQALLFWRALRLLLGARRPPKSLGPFHRLMSA